MLLFILKQSPYSITHITRSPNFHLRTSAPEFEQTLGDGEGQESLVFRSPWGCKELDMIDSLNNSIKHCSFPGGSVVKNLPNVCTSK